MIKHIVLFKLKPMEASEKDAKMAEIKAGLESLLGKVPTLRAIEVGINVNPSETFDIALVTIFDDMEGLHAYAVHPNHVTVGKIIGAVKEDRACVDFTI